MYGSVSSHGALLDLSSNMQQSPLVATRISALEDLPCCRQVDKQVAAALRAAVKRSLGALVAALAGR